MIDTMKGYARTAGTVLNAGVNEIKRRQTQAGVDKIKAEQARLAASAAEANQAKSNAVTTSMNANRNERLYGNPGMERRPAPPPVAPSQPQYMRKREEKAGTASPPPQEMRIPRR